jgi:hypothetical protein
MGLFSGSNPYKGWTLEQLTDEYDTLNSLMQRQQDDETRRMYADKMIKVKKMIDQHATATGRTTSSILKDSGVSRIPSYHDMFKK